MSSQGYDVPNNFDGGVMSMQYDNNDNNFEDRREMVDSTPWPSWTPELVNNYRDELHRVAVGPPHQDKKPIANALDNVMDGMQGGIYVKIYNFNKTWKMPDNWQNPANLRQDEETQEQVENNLRDAESNYVDLTVENDQEYESLKDIMEQQETLLKSNGKGSNSVKGISTRLADLLSLYYISVLKMANLFYGRNNNDYPFMRIPIVWKIIMNHLKNVHGDKFEQLIALNKDGTVEQFMEAVVPPAVHGGHGWRLYLLIYMVLRRFIKYKVGMVTENLKSRWNGYLANEESFAYAYGLEISVKMGSTFSKNNYAKLSKSQKNAIMERIEKECHRNFAKFGRMECKKLAYYKYVKNNTDLWPRTPKNKEERKKGDYPSNIPKGTKIKEVTTLRDGKYKHSDLLEQSYDVDEIDDKLWCGPKIMQIKHGKEYVYAENNAVLLRNLNIALVKLFKRLKRTQKKFKIQHTSGVLEFKVTNHKEAEALYDEKQYLRRWATEERPLIWTQIKELLKGTRVEKRKINPALIKEIEKIKGNSGSRTIERKSKKGKKNPKKTPRMLKDLMEDLNLKF
jgi:hypothetical protein